MAAVTTAIKMLVRGLFEDKQMQKELDDSVTKSNTELKKYLTEHKIDEMVVDDIKVSYKCQERCSMDEQKTIQIIKEQSVIAGSVADKEEILGCIGTREYVDSDKLESLIYNGKINKDDLIDAQIIKPVYVLNLRQSKKAD